MKIIAEEGGKTTSSHIFLPKSAGNHEGECITTRQRLRGRAERSRDEAEDAVSLLLAPTVS